MCLCFVAQVMSVSVSQPLFSDYFELHYKQQRTVLKEMFFLSVLQPTNHS